MKPARSPTISANDSSMNSVMLRHISGLRGALLSLLPLLLLMANLSVVLLVALVIDTSAQLWLWSISWLLVFVGSCVCYGWLHRCRQQTRIEMPSEPAILTIQTPVLGAWNFSLKQLIGFQAYTSESASQRKRGFFMMLIVVVLGLCVMLLFFDWYLLFFVMPLILISYPLLQNNKPAPFQSGIILHFAKTDDLHSLVQAPASIHICATDTTIQYLTSIAKPIIEENTKNTSS